jgi:hypothetical protein
MSDKASRDVCGRLVDAALPEELMRMRDEELPSRKACKIQAFLAGQCVSPFSADALLGKRFSAPMIALKNTTVRIGATGFTAMSHNP